MPVMHQDRIALDRAASVRTIDQDGHLHVADSVISRAEVNGYYGREIPDFEKLGLQPDKEYQLLRDPAELEKSAPTFDGKPLVIIHRPQTAGDHDREVTVGAISNPYWKAPDLRAKLTVWDAEAIEGIDSREQCDLSSGYRYKAVMLPGVYHGVRYDGRMEAIFGNHVCLVADGRVSGSIVGDSKSKEQTHMTTKLSRQALLASGALHAYIRPKLAKDATLDFGPLLAGVTGKTWKADKAKLKLAMDKAIIGKLAADADITDVVEMLDQLEEMADETTANDEEAETEEEKKARLAKRAADKAAKDAEPDDKDKDKDTVNKTAMDAAILAAVTKTQADTRAATIADMRAIQEAERAVRPHIGDIVIAQDSSEAVYKLALDLKGIDTAGVPPAAYAAMVKMLALPGTVTTGAPRLAQDAIAGEEAKFRKAYPGASRLIRS